MNVFSKLVQASLLLTTPALLAHPAPHIEVQRSIQIPDMRTLSYDEAIDLLALIESDAFEENLSSDQLDQINEFVSFLAMEGAAEEEKYEIANAAASLFRKDTTQYALFSDTQSGYSISPAIYCQTDGDIVLTKSWFKKQWDQTRAFVKTHKKAILIGTIVVVTVVVVVVAAVAISASAASAAAASGAASIGGVEEFSSSPQSIPSSLRTQVATFKETIAKEQFDALTQSDTFSIEENGRIIGSLFAHKAVEELSIGASQNPFLAKEFHDLGFHSQYPAPKWHPQNLSPHQSTDTAFATDYATTLSNHFTDLNSLSYQVRGDTALSSQCYHQALQDFGKAIELNPNNPTLYLERGIANFELGNYENSLSDYTQYVEKKGEPLSPTEFTYGLAKGIPKGVYESGKGALLFLSEFIAHPIQTSSQLVDSLSQLATLVKNDQYGLLAEALSPELHQLATQWDTLPSETKGELAGYALGKLGTDLMAPGAISKVASKSLNSAKELASICKNIQLAQETLILETASGIGIPAKVSEIVEMAKNTANLGEELGFSSNEIAQLHKAGKLETTIGTTYEHLSPPMRESFELFERAQNFLKPYKGYMTESQARELIHQAGVRTFPRPRGIPDNFRVKISDKGAGMKYVHPSNEDTYVRVMPGKSHSPFSYQQNPYVSCLKNGNYVDKNGSIVSRKDPAAHIPLDEFIFGE